MRPGKAAGVSKVMAEHAIAMDRRLERYRVGRERRCAVLLGI